MNAYYKIPKLYGIENITTEEVMDKLDMFQEIFGKVGEFGWWDMDIIRKNSCTQFTPKEFKECLNVHGVRIKLSASYHKEINGLS